MSLTVFLNDLFDSGRVHVPAIEPLDSRDIESAAYRTRSAIRSLGRSQQATEVLTGLDAVHALPQSLCDSVEAKAALGAVVLVHGGALAAR